MLKNIKLHISSDLKQQEKYEQKLAEQIHVLKNKNINAFERFVPNLAAIVKTTGSRNISLFCNKTGEFNLVDYGQGRVFYGFHPEAEVQQHIQTFAQNATYVDVAANSEVASNPIQENPDLKAQSFKELHKWQATQSYSALPQEIDCLVLLGCGLGYQISWLIQHYTIKHLIVYEPEGQYFQSSTHILDWTEIFNVARAKGTVIYLQVGKDSRDIIHDINELSGIIDLQGFYLYKHYHHPVFNNVYDACTGQKWQKLLDQGISFSGKQTYLDYLPHWLPGCVTEQYKDVNTEDEHFIANLDAFKEYFPDIYAEFKDYNPIKWMAVENESGEINIVHMQSLTNWYSDSPREDCERHYENFNLQPNKDGLALGYTGKKLKHYRHYKFVAKTESLLKKIEEVKGSLPDKIKSIIVFGLGSGYQLETLIDKHHIDYIFVCEPNRDFFYASLFAIPWATILKSIADNKQRIYLNIGDDGTNLTRDLINQFYSVGPYIVNSTYFYQSYFNSSLNAAISQLREQLQVIIAMGEYFDHAWYGIHQTQKVLQNNAPVLLKNPGQKLNFENKEVPIFVVGNGPSIDIAIAYLHEYRDQVILVSCGTALRVLHRHGITPDFQAEIEQNRTTYDWAVLVDDLDYLKNISLISCNGIHPDTCSLYKDVYITFKDGESSTVSSTNILGEDNFELLKFAFPTVANFAVNLFTSLEFSTIYLVGIDLGFVSKQHHHSKSSSYYLESGKELYNYNEENNTSLVVPGNFRPVVNTKHEFKISRFIIEQTLATTNKSSQIYNTSDGAKIAGTFPLKIENLLITTSLEQRFDALNAVKEKSFKAVDGEGFTTHISKSYQHPRLLSEIDRLLKLLESPPDTIDKAEKYIEKQKLTLFSSYEKGDNLLFYYLYGTSNYANAFLTKLLCAESPDGEVPQQFFDGLAMWQEFLEQLKEVLNLSTEVYDNSHFNIHQREFILIKTRAKDKKVLVVSNSTGFVKSFDVFNATKIKCESKFTYCDSEHIPEQDFDYIIYNNVPEYNGHFDVASADKYIKSIKKGKLNTMIFVYEQEKALSEYLKNCVPQNVSFIPFSRDTQNALENKQWVDHHAFLAGFVFKVLYETSGTQIYLPKYFLINNKKENEFKHEFDTSFIDYNYIAEFKFHLSCNINDHEIELLSTSGTRGKQVTKLAQSSFEQLRIYTTYSDSDYHEGISRWLKDVPELAQDTPFSGIKRH